MNDRAATDDLARVSVLLGIGLASNQGRSPLPHAGTLDRPAFLRATRKELRDEPDDLGEANATCVADALKQRKDAEIGVSACRGGPGERSTIGEDIDRLAAALGPDHLGSMD